MSDDAAPPDGTAARHATARAMAERAIKAQAGGEDEEAERLFAEAGRIDPDAVADVLSENVSDEAATGADAAPQDDDEIAAMSRTIQPGSDAPSRSGIGGSGSGADEQD